MQNTKLSIMIPAYNESRTICFRLEKLKQLQLPNQIQKEIVVVNDCSTDDTEIIVQKFREENPQIEVVYCKHERNKGKGSAIRTAIAHISGNVAIVQDADLEYDPEDINTMLTYFFEHRLKVLYGSRFLDKQNRHSYSRFYWGGRLVSWVANILFLQRLTDEPTCYKMLDVQFLKQIPLRCTGFEFCPEITAKIAKKGIKIKEIPVRYYPRSIEEGKKIKWYDGLEAIWTLFKYRFVN